MTELATVTPPQPISLVAKIAAKYSVDPAKLLDTLKNTAFKQKHAAVTNEQMMALLIVADQYGLNPFTKEIYAFPDQNGIVPVVGVDGWARIINEHPMFDGMEFAEPDGANSCTCTIYRKDRAHPTTITEYMVECKRSTGPWGSHPRRLLRHKSMIQCARLAFGFAGIYDPDEAQAIGAAASPATTGLDAVRAATRPPAKIIDPATGEIDTDTREVAVSAEVAAHRARVLASMHEQIKICTDREVLDLVADGFRDWPASTEKEALTVAYRAKDQQLAEGQQ